VRVLLACDKFKGSLSGAEVNRILAETWLRLVPDCDVDCCPIADGGEGTTQAVVIARGGRIASVPSLNALDEPIESEIGLLPPLDGQPDAVAEMSSASGLAMLAGRRLEPLRANTRGTGLLMMAARNMGAGHLLLGIGGSATNDGGCGMAQALGFRFLDASGRELQVLPRDLMHLHRILPPPQPLGLQISVACDVTNPLLGPQGCSAVYGRQKGIDDPQPHEQALAHLAMIVKKDLGLDLAGAAGSGAAGGLGFGLQVFAAAKLQSGFDWIASLLGLEARVAAADLIITGEGRMDQQTLHGKGPMGVASLAAMHGKPVVAIAGRLEHAESLAAHFADLVSCSPPHLELEAAMKQAAALLEQAALGALPRWQQLATPSPLS
jgi:glycerate kinase